MEIVTKEMFEDFKNELNEQLIELKNAVENKQIKKIMKNKELLLFHIYPYHCVPCVQCFPS